MKKKYIDIDKMKNAFYATMIYLAGKKLLEEKNQKIEKLCNSYQKRWSKILAKATNEQELDIFKAQMDADVKRYRMTQNTKFGVYEIVDKLKRLEKFAIVDNKNPLNENMAPSEVTSFRAFYETMVAKYGFDTFLISHKKEQSMGSSFDFFKLKYGQNIGKDIEDVVFVVKDDDSFVGHKALVSKNLKNFDCENYVFEDEEEYKKFAQKNKIFEYHKRYALDEQKLKKYMNAEYDFDIFARYAYVDSVTVDELKSVESNLMNTLWQVMEYKNKLWKIQISENKNI